jgi:hypothetical protein
MPFRGGDSHRKTASIKKERPGHPRATDCIQGPGPHSSRTLPRTGHATDCLARLRRGLAGLRRERPAALTANATRVAAWPRGRVAAWLGRRRHDQPADY